jgi:hypothetical protein
LTVNALPKIGETIQEAVINVCSAASALVLGRLHGHRCLGECNENGIAGTFLGGLHSTAAAIYDVPG